VRDLADRDRRSVHAELLWLIERGADAEEGKKGRTRWSYRFTSGARAPARTASRSARAARNSTARTGAGTAATVTPSRLPEFFQEIQDAFTQAGDEDSVLPIRHFYQRWSAGIAIGRRPSVAARLHAAEQALADPDPAVRDQAVREAAEIVQAAYREVVCGWRLALGTRHRWPTQREPSPRIPWPRSLEVLEPSLKITRLRDAAVAEVGDLVVLVLVEDIMEQVEAVRAPQRAWLRGQRHGTDAEHVGGRRVIFLGDLVVRGPASPAVSRLVMGMVSSDRRRGKRWNPRSS
jgi:hypothetical protein